MKASLTVFFEEPFWVGVFERIEDGKLSVEIETRQAADNPKRRLRNARKHLVNTGIGTKSQQALQKQREEIKTERRQISREERDVEARRRFEMKQAKKKEKKRGH